MSRDTDHRKLCHALFDALERADVDAVARCYADDMTLWFNITGNTIGRDENLDAVRAGAALHRRRTYDDRIINTFDDGFLVQYTLTVVAHDGSKHTLWACLVAQVRDGLIVKLDEYLDSSKFGGRRRGSGRRSSSAGAADASGSERVGPGGSGSEASGSDRSGSEAAAASAGAEAAS